MAVDARATVQVNALTLLFARHDDRRDVQRRAHLHRAGDPLHHGYLVVTGWFARFRTGAGGTEAVTAVHLPGDIIGLDLLFEAGLRDEVTALSDATVLRLPMERLREAIAGGGGAAMDAARLLAEDAAFLREALFAVGTQASYERLGAFIVQTHDRLATAGLLAPGVDSFALPLTQSQLGAVTGLTSVHINRVLRQLRLAGLLDIRGGWVRVHDLPGLRRAAQRRPEPRPLMAARGEAFA